MSFVTQLVKRTQNLASPKLSEQLVYNNLEQKLNKWNIPKVSPTKIYNKDF